MELLGFYKTIISGRYLNICSKIWLLSESTKFNLDATVEICTVLAYQVQLLLFFF